MSTVTLSASLGEGLVPLKCWWLAEVPGVAFSPVGVLAAATDAQERSPEETAARSSTRALSSATSSISLILWSIRTCWFSLISLVSRSRVLMVSFCCRMISVRATSRSLLVLLLRPKTRLATFNLDSVGLVCGWVWLFLYPWMLYAFRGDPSSLQWRC